MRVVRDRVMCPIPIPIQGEEIDTGDSLTVFLGQKGFYGFGVYVV